MFVTNLHICLHTLGTFSRLVLIQMKCQWLVHYGLRNNEKEKCIHVQYRQIFPRITMSCVFLTLQIDGMDVISLQNLFHLSPPTPGMTLGDASPLVRLCSLSMLLLTHIFLCCQQRKTLVWITRRYLWQARCILIFLGAVD